MAKKTNPRRSKLTEEVFQRALALRDAGDRQGAEALLNRLAEEDPEDLDVLIVLGGVLSHQEKWAEAAGIFQRLLAARPANEPASLGLFLSLWHLERRRDAIGEMERFLSIAESNEYERLLKDLERAVALGADERP